MGFHKQISKVKFTLCRKLIESMEFRMLGSKLGTLEFTYVHNYVPIYTYYAFIAEYRYLLAEVGINDDTNCDQHMYYLTNLCLL